VEYATKFFKKNVYTCKSTGSLDKPAEKAVKLDVCENCAKSVTDDATECFWCNE